MPADTRVSLNGPRAVRHFARFQLLNLVGKSEQCMLWRVLDPRDDGERLLALPRRQPINDDAAARVHARLRHAARLDHPGLAPQQEQGVHERWPFAVYDAAAGPLLSDLLGGRALAGRDVVRMLLRPLQGLASAHDAGLHHGDLQPWMLMCAPGADSRLLGLGLAVPAGMPSTEEEAADAVARQSAAERDLLALGLIMLQALSGAVPLGEPDVSLQIERLPPVGDEAVRLPPPGRLPLAPELRAIVHRATDRQPRLRYRSARALERALAGWWRASAETGGGPLNLLTERIRLAGVLPSAPGTPRRSEQLAMLEQGRNQQIADLVLQDPALAFELLRQVNSAAARAEKQLEDGPILTVRRAVALLGINGVRRAHAALRPWPGVLAAEHVAAMATELAQASQAAALARQLCPAGYDLELVGLLALLQRLGRLLLQYHFPRERLQIRALMQALRPGGAVGADEAGLNEHSATCAVLGVDAEALATALVRQWGWDEAAVRLVRRCPADAVLREDARDDEQLRAVASCANDLVDLVQLPQPRQLPELIHLHQRLGAGLGLSRDDLAQAWRQALGPGSADEAWSTELPALAPTGPKAVGDD